MNNPIKLKENIFSVVVPKDTAYKISGLNYFCVSGGLYWDRLVKLEGKFEILGEATADSISFDVEPYVERLENCYRFKDYMDKSVAGRYFDYPCLSFYSLLQSKEIYFVNPIEKPDFMDGTFDDDGFGEVDKRRFKKHLAEWQEAESKLVEKVVIIKKV